MLDQNQHFIHTTMREAGIDPRGMRDFLEACRERGSDLHEVLLLRDGKAVFEGCFAPYQPADKRHVYSVSKSWTATAVGFAVQEGRLSLHDKVVSFFPEDCPAEISENLAEMEVRDLLRMGGGHDTEPVMKAGESWVHTFLHHPVLHKPGTKFLYNTPGSYMLAAILRKVTGQDLIDYLKPRLFEPLGIEGVFWDHSPEGICCGGFGIHVSAEDIAKLGMVYLNGGMFEGRRILSEEWVREATSKQIDNAPNTQADWAQGYGYQIWRCQHNCFRFDGAFGQYMVAIPEKNALLVVLSHTDVMQVLLDALWEYLLPAFDREPQESGLSEDFCCPVPELPGKEFAAEFRCEKNDWGICTLMVQTGSDGGEICLKSESGEMKLPFGTSEWRRAEIPDCLVSPDVMRLPVPSTSQAVGAAGGWDEDALSVTVRYCGTPHTMVWRLSTCPPVLSFTCENQPVSGKNGEPGIVLEPVSHE